LQELGALGPSPANKPPLDDLNASGRVTKTIEESYPQNKGHPTTTNENSEKAKEIYKKKKEKSVSGIKC